MHKFKNHLRWYFHKLKHAMYLFCLLLTSLLVRSLYSDFHVITTVRILPLVLADW